MPVAHRPTRLPRPAPAPRRPRQAAIPTTLLALLVVLATVACGRSEGAGEGSGTDRPRIVVTYPVLGAVVADIVGDQADVRVLMGNGIDPHDWSPSAKDIEAVRHADLVVANGLGLEEGLADALREAAAAGVPVFSATDHLTVRALDGATGHARERDPHEDEGGDPHFWVDPVSMASVATALVEELSGTLGLDVGRRGAAVVDDLRALDAEIRADVATLPENRRKLVTGHESLGYFADRYGFELVGAVVPASTSQAEPSAAQLAALERQVRAAGVRVVFTEIGTPTSVARAIAAGTGATVVELPSHNLPADGRYRSFLTGLADTIVAALAA